MQRLGFLVWGLTFSVASFAQLAADAETCEALAKTVDERLAACTRVIESGRGPTDLRAHLFFIRSGLWTTKRDLDPALKDLNETIRLDPKFAFAYGTRGYIWLMKGEDDRAIADFNEGIRLDPTIARFYLHRAEVLMRKDEFDRALADFTEVIRLDTEKRFREEPYYKRAVAWAIKGETERAVADFSEAIRINPSHARSLNLLAWYLAVARNDKIRDGKRAIALATRACELTSWKEPRFLDTLAATYAEGGQFAEAIRWQEKALEFPEFEKAQGSSARMRLNLYRAGKPHRE